VPFEIGDRVVVHGKRGRIIGFLKEGKWVFVEVEHKNGDRRYVHPRAVRKIGGT
jgi:hypothetical protein